MKNGFYSGVYLYPLLAISSCTFAATLPASLSGGSSAQNMELASFDTTTLKSRGISPEVAEYFAHGARFAPGMQKVSLIINGNEKGDISLFFNESGAPCFDKEFSEYAGLKVTDAVMENRGDAQEHICYDYASAWPGSIVTLKPGQEKVELVVPQEALENANKPKNYRTGGTAALLNYNMFTSQSHYSGGSSDYNQGTFEAGLNMADWLARSQFIVSDSDGEKESSVLYGYVQHTFAGIEKTMQAGAINVQNTPFSLSGINGVQLTPESALKGDVGSGVTVTGIARSDQARVEIRQNGVQIMSTLVPAGPFTLTDVPIANTNTDLQVAIKETNGASSQFTVPAANLAGARLQAPEGWSFAAGSLRDVDTDYHKPWLITATNSWQVSQRMNVSLGAMTAEKYQSLAASTNVVPTKDLSFYTTTLGAWDQRNDHTGNQFQIGANYRLPWNMAVNLSATHNTAGYRSLVDTLQDDNEASGVKNSYSAGLSWSNAYLGSLSFSLSQSEGFDSDSDARQTMLTWGKSFKYASLNASWQHALSTPDSDNDDYRDDDTFYVSISIPFGGHSVQSYMRDDGEKTRYGLQANGPLTSHSNYSVTAEKGEEDSDKYVAAGVSSNLHYTSLSLNASKTGDDFKNYSANMSGGIVAHGHGVTLSPYQIQDTFSVVSFNDNVSGIEVSTPQGPVWTDFWGQAISASATPYKVNTLEVNTETLPGNIDINNGIKKLTPGHGSVTSVNFGVIRVRRAMLTLRLPDGKPIPKGDVLVDAKNQYVTTAVEDGLVFISDVDATPDIYAKVDLQGHLCRVQFTLDEQDSETSFYQKADATCQRQ
ncbi:fimbrial protein [Salmonella enterica subsp. enterica serovar Lattenkamp]|nr:fimbrial protein [Salmonella enterica subsp. enterica serovar Lattenkamp]EHM1180353.1 fimbrial biogenesis usher protein [Salmonella enterica subsp. enterica serovar Lattenkamp]